MDVLGELVARDRSLSGPVLYAASSERSYEYHRFATTAMKAGNFLRQHGVRIGVLIGIADERVPEPLLALFGGLLLGATVQFDPPTKFDGRVIVTQTNRHSEYTVPNGGTVIGYGEEPSDSATAYFERGIWSENPAFPPTAVDGDTTAIRTPEREYTHDTLLAATTHLVDEGVISAGETVALRGSLTSPAVLVAGVFAPILAGGTIRLESNDPPDTPSGTVLVDGTDRATALAGETIRE